MRTDKKSGSIKIVPILLLLVLGILAFLATRDITPETTTVTRTITHEALQ